jgi:Fe-S-cluster containining protein
MDHGQIRRIRTLAPARRQDGACLFLDEEDRCRIHNVSPYGCSHFDARQTNEEADCRSNEGHYHVDLAWKNDHLFMIVSLLQRKNTSIRRMKELLFGMKEKERGKDEAKNRSEMSQSGAEENSQTDSTKESASSSTCEGDSSTQEVRRLKRPGHGRKADSE